MLPIIKIQNQTLTMSSRDLIADLNEIINLTLRVNGRSDIRK